MSQDTPAPTEETPVENVETPVIEDAQVEAGAETESEDEEDEGPSEVAAAIAAMGLTRMSLQELKDKSPADLLSFAETLEIENANSMRKQDMMFAILKALAEEGVQISGSGTLEVMQDGFGYLDRKSVV